MTMEIEADQPEGDIAEKIDKDQIFNDLTNNDNIVFKSQQRGESDLSKSEKTEIASEIYNKSKLNFLTRFGQYLQQEQLDFFQQFAQEGEESNEIAILLKEFYKILKQKQRHIDVKNRRYEALKNMIQKDDYFSEIEMMKRNPLLYEQLVGQYLTQEEKSERDRITINEATPTLAKILMEGIERDDAKIKQQEQENYEDRMLEDEEDEDMDVSSDDSWSQPVCSRWGEFIEPGDTSPKPKKRKRRRTKGISAEEQKLLKEEFVSSMYQHFLDGKDEDFDYATVDNNDKYVTEEYDHDEEDKYFDSEEPEIVKTEELEESEDELDIYMSALNQNPAVLQLSQDIQKL